MNRCRFSQILILSTVYCLLSTSLTGCEAMRKKFTRKKKTQTYEEPVYVPVEYKKEAVSNQVSYRNYFLYWQSWQDELISHLNSGANRKKQLECIAQVILNLKKMQQLLSEDKQNDLDLFIQESVQIQQMLLSPILQETSLSQIKNTLTLQKRQIMRQFSYSKVRDFFR